MEDFDPATSFLGEVADRYDDEPRGDEPHAVELLTELARGRALEFAVGSGRIALPLSARTTPTWWSPASGHCWPSDCALSGEQMARRAR